MRMTMTVIASLLLLPWTAGAQPAGDAPAPSADPPAADAVPEAAHELDFTPDLSGYLQVFYRFNVDTNDDRDRRPGAFRVMRARLEVKGALAERVSYDVEVDPRAPAIGGVLRDCFLALGYIPNHTLRIGQQKTTFGYENMESSTRLWAVNRTEVSDNLSRGATLRDIGIGLIGRLKLGGGFRLEDAFTVVNGAGMNVQDDDDAKKDFWGRIGVRAKLLHSRLWLGVSGGIGSVRDLGDDDFIADDDFFYDFRRIGGDVEFDNRWVFAAAEFVAGTDDVTRGPAVASGLQETGSESIHGYYATLVGKTPWRFGPLVRYDVLGEEFTRWTVGAYYGLPKDSVRVMVNSEIRNEEDPRCLALDPPEDTCASDVRTYVWVQGRF